MDRSLVLVRTESGEAAVQQPTRLVQRNLRMALMLVDGVNSAEEIAGRFSDTAIGESALADLRRAGMITLATDAKTNGAQYAGMVNSERDPIVPSPVKLPSLGKAPQPDAAASVIEVISLDDRIAPGLVSNDSPIGEKVTIRARPLQHPQQVPKASITASAADGSVSTGTDLPRRRAAATMARAGALGKFVSALAVFCVVVLLVAGFVSLYPYERHIPSIQRWLSESLGQPVRVGAIHFTWTPLPGVTLEHVVVGEDEQLGISGMRVVPDPRSMTGAEVIVHNLELDGVTVKAGSLSSVSTWLIKAADMRRLVIRHVGFVNGALVLPDTTVDGFRGDWELDDGGRPLSLHFERGDASLAGDLTPTNGACQLRLRGNGWKPEFLAPMMVDYFDADGVLTEASIQLSKVYARIADGSVFGTANVAWQGATRYGAQLDIRSVDIAKLVAQTKSDLSMQGAVSGSLKVGPAPLVGSGQGVLAEGDLSVHRAVLNRFDLVEVVRSANGHAVRGGATRFEEGAVRIRIDPQSVRLSRLRIQSGLMSADGQIAVNRNQSISGGINVELRTGSGNRRVPVSISGLLGDPVLSADRARAKPQADTML